jgi:hypothetical protein
VYVSEQYTKIQKLLDEVENDLQPIQQAMTKNLWKRADELVWQCGVTLETCRNIIKAV